jgi:hypothetical protein
MEVLEYYEILTYAVSLGYLKKKQVGVAAK